MHRAATQRREVAEDEAREEAFFKRYLEFCRARVAPRLSEPAADSLVSQYVELREQVVYNSELPDHSVDARMPLLGDGHSPGWRQMLWLSHICCQRNLGQR